MTRGRPGRAGGRRRAGRPRVRPGARGPGPPGPGRRAGERTGGALRAAAVGARPGAAGPARRTGWTPSAGGWACASRPAPRSAPADLDAARAGGTTVVLATGSRPGVRARRPPADPCPVLDPLTALAGGADLLSRTARSWCTTRSAARSASAMAEWLAAGGRDRGPGHAGPGRRDSAVPDRRPGRRQHPPAAGRGTPGAAGAAARGRTRPGAGWKTSGPGSSGRSAARRSWTAGPGWRRPGCTTRRWPAPVRPVPSARATAWPRELPRKPCWRAAAAA